MNFPISTMVLMGVSSSIGDREMFCQALVSPPLALAARRALLDTLVEEPWRVDPAAKQQQK
jgi:hypothetical protein